MKEFKDTLGDNPLKEFNLWYDKAVKENVRQPDAMTLATASKDGKPSARMVLFKGIDEKGVLFVTNYESRKSIQLLENPAGALVFYWSELDRQIRIEGTVQKATAEESKVYFATRHRESQIGAWTSKQSSALQNRKELEEKFHQMETKFKDKDVPCPPQWGGFRLLPTIFEFWQAGKFRLHDRIQYTLQNKIWSRQLLWP